MAERTTSGWPTADSSETPESRAAWADFQAAADYLTDIPRCSLVADDVKVAVKDEDVAYVAIVSTQRRYQDPARPAPPAVAYITLVCRPEVGGWLVHSMGEPELSELVPGSNAQN